MKIVKVNNYKNKEIITHNPFKFPINNISGCKDFYLSAIYGVRGAGKSTLILNMLDIEKHLLQNENKVYLISPTLDDKISLYLDKYKDNIIYYDELNITVLEKIFASIKANIDDWHFKNKLLDEEINNLDENDYHLFNSINLEHPPISTLIIDDSIHSNILCSNSKDSKKFMKYFLRHRHMYCHIFLLSQHCKSVLKSYRTNSNLIIFYPFRDGNIYKQMFDEYSGMFDSNYNNFLAIMEKIEKRNNHSFLLIYYDTKKFISINFDEHIIF
jgi:hypothetical protein